MKNGADQLARAEQFLGTIPGAAERAMARALNKAIAQAKGTAVRTIIDRYAARPSDVAGMITLTTAKPDNVEVSVRARSKALSLGYFPHDPDAPGTGGPGRPALTVEIRRGDKKSVAGAFVAKLNSGPRVMMRTGATTGSGKDEIKGLYSIPLARMLGVTSVREEVEARALEVLDQKLEGEIDRELAAAGAR